jgi:serine/threonine protein kinase
MPVIGLDKLIDDLHRSGLVEEERLSRFLAEYDAESDAEFLLHKLVEANLLTSWQAEGLLAGKWKGFFLGKYKLLQPLGRGAMGTVYLAEHKVMRHRVAIKVLAKHLMSTPNIVTRFEREARAAAVIQHPNVVRAYDIDHEDDIHFLVMEYVQGQDLKQIVEQKGPLDPHVAAEYTQQVARGLHEAHRNGLIHRDIKPANLLLDQTGLVKILDLGLARLEEDVASVTIMNDDKVLGTVDYLSPEQARNSHNIDGRADLYSLGCTLYFLMTGVPPFPTGSITERMLKHQTRRPVDMRKRRPGAPDALVQICSRLMEKNPDKRFATAGDAATVLGEFLEGRYQIPGTTSDDDILTFAEDADSGSAVRKTSQSSIASRGLGASSTGAIASQSSNTIPDQLDLAPDPGASKSSTRQPQVAPLIPAESVRAAEPGLGLTPLSRVPAAPGSAELTPLGSPATVLPADQLPAPPAASLSSPLDALPPLGDGLSGLGSLGANPLSGDPLYSPLSLSGPQAIKPTEPAEVQYPLWALLGMGLVLGLAVVGIGVLLYFVLR